MITIDVRMIYHSGIGTYIRNLLPRVIQAWSHQRIYLLGNRADLQQFDWALAKNVEIADFPWPIYTISEQLHFMQSIPKDTSLFWSPHYNIPILYRGKLITTIHDVFHLAMPEYINGLHKRIYAKMMFSTLRHKADAIISVSMFTKDELDQLTGKGHQEVYAISNGVSESWYPDGSGSSPHSKPYLLYVGNVKPHKNLKKLLIAYRLIYQQIPHDMVIVGKKEGFITGDREVVAMAESFGGRVKFSGYVDDEKLRQYYSYAETFVFPPLYEGFGLPPIEAMACGCPVIVSNVASLPEVCGDAALYCDPYSPKDIAKKIKQILSNEALRMELRKKGYKHAAKYSWDRCAQETLAVIDEVLAR